jgi:HD-like signal output (HDOD) protein
MSSTHDVEKIMANDLSLTAKVLRLVNSAYYAIPGGVTSLGRAIGYIGFDTINQLVLSTSILKALEVKGSEGFDMREFWKHSVGVGIAAETIAKFLNHPTPADLFTCGLVHDMGKVAIYTLAPEQLLAIVKKADEDKLSFLDAELDLGLMDHGIIGQKLAKKWDLPLVIQNCIKYHHVRDPLRRGSLTADAHRNVDMVFLANLLVHAIKYGHSGHSRILGAPRETLERLTLKPETDVRALLMEIKSSLGRATDFLRLLSEGLEL